MSTFPNIKFVVPSRFELELPESKSGVLDHYTMGQDLNPTLFVENCGSRGTRTPTPC